MKDVVMPTFVNAVLGPRLYRLHKSGNIQVGGVYKILLRIIK